jgi:antitoxin (DNA-binding transcriptional repressor) of toxin-antitoxin stability system
MRTIGIRELKAHLSRTLRDVERGEHYLITDRGRVVAELKQLGAGSAPTMDRQERALLKWVAEGKARLPLRPGRMSYEPLGLPPMPEGTAQAWIDWDRQDWPDREDWPDRKDR